MIQKNIPKVSILIPIYNQEKYIRECVESVLSQDYENLEVIVVDDGSTDSTPEILKEFERRIKHTRQENKGPAAALNNGLRLAQGSFVSWLGSDDAYLPGLIELQVKKFQEDPSLALIYTDYIVINSEGKKLKVMHSPFPPPTQFVITLLAGNFINGSTVMMRRECFEKVGYYDENLKASVDGDMWYRLLACGYKFGHIPQPLVKYRWHSANISHKFRLMQVYKDKVHLKAFKTFSSQGMFNSASELEQLSFAFAKQFSFQAATAAIKRAEKFETKFSFKRGFLWLLFSLMDNPLFIELIGLAKKVRRKMRCMCN